MKFLSFLPHKIFCLRRNFKNSGDVNLSVLDRTINYFLFLSTCCPVARLDLPHFTLGSSQMPFKHIHYKLAVFFPPLTEKKKTLRFLMNPYCWYYNGVNWYCLVTLVAFQVYYLIYAVVLSTLVQSCSSSWQSLIKYVIHMFISWCGVLTHCEVLFYHFVPDADVSNYVMFFFLLLLCKVLHN